MKNTGKQKKKKKGLNVGSETETKSMLEKEQHGRQTPPSEKKEKQPLASDTGKTQKKRQDEKLSGLAKTSQNTENSVTHGISESKTQSEANNLPVASETGRSMVLRDHLETLRTASSESMNLLDDTTLHLHGLMKQVAEDSKDLTEQRPWAKDNVLVVKQTVEVARELHKSMRLKLDTVKALHKISKDIDESNKK